MKNTHIFLHVVDTLVLIHLSKCLDVTRVAKEQDRVRDQAAIVTCQRSRLFFFNFFIYLLTVLFVSIISLVSVVSKEEEEVDRHLSR